MPRMEGEPCVSFLWMWGALTGVLGEAGPGTTVALGRQKLGVQLEGEAAGKNPAGVGAGNQDLLVTSGQSQTRIFLVGLLHESPGPGTE